MSAFDLFEKKMQSPPTSSETALISGTEAHAKLKRNLHQALDVHSTIMRAELPMEIPTSDRRLMLEAANTTVKAALTTDRTALKARQDNTLERVFLRVLFHAKRMGKELSTQDLERLKTAPRSELEAALSPRFLTEYDQMEF